MKRLMPRRYKMWYILENEMEYNKAIARFEELKHSKTGTDENKEKTVGKIDLRLRGVYIPF